MKEMLALAPCSESLGEFHIPNGVERIGEYLFYGRYDEGYNVTLPESIKEIGCMSLPYNMTSLTLPLSLEKIDDYVFYDGIIAENVIYNGTEEDWNKISIGEGNTALDSINVQMK